MIRRYGWILTLCLGFWTVRATAAEVEFYPGVSYDPQVPTLEEVVGHSWGEKISSHSEVEQYLKALTNASARARLVKYGETWEGRSLYYVVLASQPNMNRLTAIQEGMRSLADPRKIDGAQAEQLLASLPSIAWLAYGIHGDETSSTDAALLTAYHLLAARDDEVAQAILENSVVILDPIQNPDGRDRFVHHFRQTVGRWPDADQQAAEHNQPWPGGRTNHYLFDMNRDWFAQTQPESRGRVKAYLEWFPQVVVDLHEMSSDSTYYFAPPATPLNPELTDSQIEWLKLFGRNNARWFDRMRFDYFTREVYDSFYPGYGEGWPLFQGSIGMTYEQASVRGLLIERSDESLLRYQDAVQHHFISSLATLETAARNREKLLRHFYDFRRQAVESGRKEAVKEFILTPARDSNRTAKLVSRLMAQGIEVKKALKPFTNPKARNFYGRQRAPETFPAGSYIISLAQPAKHLIKTLISRETPLDPEFIKEQLRRYEKRLDLQFYDITGWSVALLYDVEAYEAQEPSQGEFVALESAPAAGGIQGGKASLAYLVQWQSNSAAQALAMIMRRGIRVYSAGSSFTLNGTHFPGGSLVLKTRDNPADLHQQLEEIARETGVNIYPTDTAWVDEGINLGSEQVYFLEKPTVAMAWREPTQSNSAGWARYILEQQYGYPVTLIAGSSFPGADLSQYNVLILPDGGYGDFLNESSAGNIKKWIESGGTLITIGGATRWLTGEKVGLLSTKREFKGGQTESDSEKPQKAPDGQPSAVSGQPAAFNLEKAIEPDQELPPSIPGAVLRVSLDTEHWLAFGYDGDTNGLVQGRDIFRPLKLDKGTNVGVYMAGDDLVLSGFIWEEAKEQIAHKAYLMHQSHGRGQVVAFAEDPNFRAFCDGLNLLFMNAVLLGPARTR
ncbi:MAG: M14 family metallopeptidase [Acidobacteriota bacterium]